MLVKSSIISKDVRNEIEYQTLNVILRKRTIKDLKKVLDYCVSIEDYENASKTRDLIYEKEERN